MATALVTGATGFVGSWLVRILLEADHRVRVLYRNPERLNILTGLDVEPFQGDMTTPETLGPALNGVDWVFHVAAVADYWRTGKAKIYQVNVDGTRHLLNACQKASIERFIFTSSVAAIGYRADGKPANESDYFSIDPRLSPYGHSKFLAEAEVYRAIKNGLDAVILNPTVIFGPGDLNLISGSLIREVAGGRVPFLPAQGGITLIDVRDVAQAHLAAAEKGRSGERYLLGTVNMSHRALMRLVAHITGARAPFIPSYRPMVMAFAAVADLSRAVGIQLPGDVEGNQLRLSTHELYFDCSKAWRDLHEPQIDITQSIADTYDWYQVNGYIT